MAVVVLAIVILEKKKKRPRDSKASPATVVITDAYNFRAKVHKFTGMPTPPANSTSEESERMPPVLFKPGAQRAGINVPLTTLPFLSSVLTNSTNFSNLPLTDHVLKLPLIEGDRPYEAHMSNSMLQLPGFSENKASNSVSLQFKELLEELELTEMLQYEIDVYL
jgi:hypothetical protein